MQIDIAPVCEADADGATMFGQLFVVVRQDELAR